MIEDQRLNVSSDSSPDSQKSYRTRIRARGNLLQKQNIMENKPPGGRNNQKTFSPEPQASGSTAEAVSQDQQNPVVRAIYVTEKLALHLEKVSSKLVDPKSNTTSV